VNGVNPDKNHVNHKNIMEIRVQTTKKEEKTYENRKNDSDRIGAMLYFLYGGKPSGF